MPSFTVQHLTSIVKDVAAAGTAEPLVATSTPARSLMLMAKKVTGDNAGNIFIGVLGLVKGSAEALELLPGDYWEYPTKGNEVIDLADIYIDADTSLDGIVGLYMPAPV